MRVYNFSAGPGMLPLEVLEEAGRQITDYEGSGMSVMELSHRGKVYEPIHNECISLVRELMNVSDEYEVLLLQGGASTQFEAVPLNLLKKGRADYVVTGNFSNARTSAMTSTMSTSPRTTPSSAPSGTICPTAALPWCPTCPPAS